jgi:outer membrane lipoprotein-sorting protein
MKHRTLLFALALLTLSLGTAQAETAKEIVRKANDKMRGKSSYSVMTMKVVKPTWSREFSMKIWSIEPDYAIIYITSPARDKGTVTLKRKKEVWNWIPAARRVIKIPPSMMQQPWMGSNFSNDDLVRESSIIRDYEHKLAGSNKIEGYDCHKIVLIPKPDAGIVYSKVVMWVSKDDYLQLKSQYYDEDGSIVKTMKGSDVKKMGGRLIPTKLEMIPHDKKGEKTVLIYNSIDFNKKLKKSFFSEKNMKRVR